MRLCAPALLLVAALLLLVSVSASDLEALLALKTGFNDPAGALSSWNNQNTNSSTPCLGWKGISCFNNRVVNITLPRVFKGGQITPAIGNLPFLHTIDLSDNSLNGTIPPEITQLKNLSSLDLSKNLLVGNLPENWSNLTQLSILYLYSNSLNGSIPDSLSQALLLQRLRLENNNFSGGIPPQITALQQLRYLAVEHNNLRGPLPLEFGNLSSLRSFYAADNQLNDSIPESVGNLTKLLHFEVEGNRLSGTIPESLGNLTSSLLTLNLSYNQFTGPVPAALAKFPASSFENNPSLCGNPLANCTSNYAPPPKDDNGGTSSGREEIPSRKPSSSAQKVKIIGGVVGGVVGAFALVILLVLFLRRKNHKSQESQVQNWFNSEIQANRRQGKFVMLFRNFKYTYDEIVSHAGYFDTAHVLGKGRFATVYRSYFPDGVELAVKVFKFANLPANFEKEIEMLGSIKHRFLLPIKGFYSNPVEKAVFYDYLPTGTLYDLLHGQNQNSDTLPDWPARQAIALGVAQGLAYLHRGCGLRILHKDLKSTNILLETGLAPRICDFGLAQLIKPQDSTAVVETPGYTAPEVMQTKKHTEKSDVYSYGVVLLELITGKKAVSYFRERSVNLTNWVTRLHKEKRGREVMDAMALQTCISPEFLDKALNLAVLCVDANPSVRPTMSEVASILEGLVTSSNSPLRSPELRMDRPLL